MHRFDPLMASFIAFLQICHHMRSLCARNSAALRSPCLTMVIACRLFLRKLKMELKIPVLALVDSDPYGLKILAVYMKGARAELNTD